MTTRGALKPSYADKYSHLEPLPDPPREPDMQQSERMLDFKSILKPHFAHRGDVLISGEGYLRHDAGGDMTGSFAPDCVVAFGVDSPRGIIARNGYVISEVGKPPEFVLEVASRSTGRRDYTVKRAGYARYGVLEYWRFDHTGGKFHDAPLAGDTLVDGEYRPLPIHREADGLIWGYSAVLELDLCWEDGELRLRNPLTGEFLPTPTELQAQRDVVEAQRAAAEAQRDTAQAQRAAAEAQRDAAQAEAAELREQLRRLQQG